MALLIAAVAVASYLLGTFPSAILVARSRGVDITTAGSGNPGASNVARVLGTRWGLLVFALDAAKGAIPAAIGLLIERRPASYLFVAAATLGHMFPLLVVRGQRRLAGGKGVATAGGAMLVMQPVVSVVLLAVWIVVRKVSGKASLASIVIAVALPVGAAVVGSPAWEVAAIVALSLVVVARHGDNITRLLRGRELDASAR